MDGGRTRYAGIDTKPSLRDDELPQATVPKDVLGVVGGTMTNRLRPHQETATSLQQTARSGGAVAPVVAPATRESATTKPLTAEQAALLDAVRASGQTQAETTLPSSGQTAPLTATEWQQALAGLAHSTATSQSTIRIQGAQFGNYNLQFNIYGVEEAETAPSFRDLLRDATVENAIVQLRANPTDTAPQSDLQRAFADHGWRLTTPRQSKVQGSNSTRGDATLQRDSLSRYTRPPQRSGQRGLLCRRPLHH